MKKVLVLLLVALATLGLAGCKKGGSNQNSTDLRVLNAVADAEPLDVLVNDDVKAPAVPLNGTSGYVNFNSGSQDTKVRSSTTQAILLDTFPAERRAAGMCDHAGEAGHGRCVPGG